MNNNNKLIIAVENSEGKIISKQDFNNFFNKPSNIEIINLYTGQKLFDILLDELGYIKWEENKWVFRYILNQNPLISVMQILGRIAEAIIVRDCNNNEILNNIWFSKARLMKNTNKKFSKKFKAIGTGLLSTKKQFSQKYNPFDPQRDIVWIDKKDRYALVSKKSSQISGLIAGLQIKVSTDYKNYILQDILNSKYENPIVYFDLNEDFYNLVGYLTSNNVIQPNEIGTNIIQGKSINVNTHIELLHYYELINAIINNKLTIEHLISNPDAYGDKNILKNVIIGNSFNIINNEDILF
jgi:3-deoxy-7-phosphoheptulonate synthase